MYDETVKNDSPHPKKNQKRNIEVNLIVNIAVVDNCYITLIPHIGMRK